MGKIGITGNTKVITRGGIVNVNMLKDDSWIRSSEGFANVKGIVRESLAPVYEIVIETYARTLELTCTYNSEFLTDKGWVKADKLIKGMALLIKGIFVKTRYSVIKNVKRKKRNDYVYYVSTEDNNFFANDIIVR